MDMTKLKGAEMAIRTSVGWQAIDLSATYPDSMPLVKDFAPSLEISEILLRPKTLHTFMTAMFWVDAYDENTLWVSRPRLLLPFVPGARQDRKNPDGDFLFTAKSIAKEINERLFEQVRVLDPHSDVIAALIDKCSVVHYTARFLLETFGGRYNGVIAPDSGAEKRAHYVAKALNLPLYHAWKKRSTVDGSLMGFGAETIPPGRFLVVDDICDGGGTFIGLANHLPSDVRLDLFVSHGLFTQGTEKLLLYYNNIYCTDSVVGYKSGVHVLDLAFDLF